VHQVAIQAYLYTTPVVLDHSYWHKKHCLMGVPDMEHSVDQEADFGTQLPVAEVAGLGLEVVRLLGDLGMSSRALGHAVEMGQGEGYQSFEENFLSLLRQISETLVLGWSQEVLNLFGFVEAAFVVAVVEEEVLE